MANKLLKIFVIFLFTSGVKIFLVAILQIKGILDEIVEKLPEEFNMTEIMAKVPPEERSPYVLVAFQECERMNMLTNEIRRSLKELDLGLKVSTISCKNTITWV